MNNEIYIEKIESEAKKEPKAKALLCLIFGIASLLLGDIGGLVLGIIALKLSSPFAEDFPNTKSAKVAAAGRIMGVIGISLSVAALVLLGALALIAIWLIAGGTFLGIPLI